MTPTLLDHHIADLRASGLGEETIAAAGFRSCSAAEVLSLLGMDAGSGLAIPYIGAAYGDGSEYVRVRLDRPFATKDGHSAKYLTKPAEVPHIYTPPGMPESWREDVTLRLLVTEGEKKSCAATQFGFPCLGVAGVWSWLTNGEPLPDFDQITWKGREVVVVGDSDLRQNAQAAEGFKRLCRGLISRGAHAKLVFLPPDGEAKVGADDYIVKHGTEAFAKVLAEAAHPDPAMPALQREGEAKPAEQAAPALRIIELRDFLADTTPLPPDVIAGVSKAGTILSIFGPAESGKSHLGIDLCLAVAAGRDWLGRFPTNKGATAYVEQERAEFLVRERIRDLAKGADFPDDGAEVYIIPKQSVKFDTVEAQEDFRRQIVELFPRIVVIDTAIAVAGCVQFLDPGQVRPWMEFWRRLAVEIAGVVCLICHVPKWIGKEPTLAALYGSEDFGASLDYAFATVPIDAGKHVFRLTCVKNTWGLDRPDLSFEIMPNPDGGIMLAASAPVYGGVRTLIMENMTDDWIGGAAFARVVEKAGFSSRAARDTLTNLVKDGLIEDRPDPKNKRWHQYRRPAEGGE